jgi:hypothetical protein
VGARAEQTPGHAVQFLVDGQRQQAYAGDTIAVALYRAGRRAWRKDQAGGPRGLLCGMGTCFDCLLTVDGAAGLRACQVVVREGMVVETGWREGE